MAISSVLWASCLHAAAGQRVEPIHPVAGTVVYQTLPFFQWRDAVAHPFPGMYRIQIARDGDFKTIVDDDTVPACIRHYSPTKELGAGQSYFWRVQYSDPAGETVSISAPVEFTIRRPEFVIDVGTTDTFDDIVAKLSKAKANSGKGALLRFPRNHTCHLAQTLDDPGADQESGEGVLLDVSGASNLVIDGRGSRIILRACPLAVENITSKTKRREGRPEVTVTTTRDCGFFFARQSRHVQVSNLTLDYENDSLMQYAGRITRIDPATGEINVEVDTRVYGNFEEMKPCRDVYFVDAANNQRIGRQGVAYPMNQSWQQSALGDGRFHFRVGQWSRFGDELKVGDWAVTSRRGGDAFIAFNGCEDIVVNNCRVEGCRGRYFIVKQPQPNIRCINNRVEATTGHWRVYSTPELRIGVDFDHCTNVSGAGNTISDPRLDKASWLRVDDSCSEVMVSVAHPN